MACRKLLSRDVQQNRRWYSKADFKVEFDPDRIPFDHPLVVPPPVTSEALMLARHRGKSILTASTKARVSERTSDSWPSGNLVRHRFLVRHRTREPTTSCMQNQTIVKFLTPTFWYQDRSARWERRGSCPMPFCIEWKLAPCLGSYSKEE